ncbi:unnamed protein product [Closterium sp. NIES-53]
MEVARTSMIHAAAPHFLWPFAIRYAAHQLNLWPRVSLPETSPRLRWTEKVGDASVFELWVLQPYLVPSQDVTFDESVPFYRLFPYRSAPLPPPLLFLAPGPPPVDPLPPQGPPPPGVSQVDPPPGAVPSEVAVDLGVARRTASGGAEPGVANPVGAEPGGSEHWGTETGGAEPGGPENGGAEPGGAEPEGVEPGGAKSEGAESRGAEPQGATSSGVIGAGAAGAGGAVVSAGAGVPGGTAATGPRSTRTQGTGAAGTGGVGGVGAGNPTESGAAGARGSGAGGVGAGGVGVGDTDAGGAGSQPSLQPASPLPAPSPYTEQTGGLTERREPASCPASLVRTGRRVPHPRPPSVPGTHAMTLRPSSIPLRVPVPAPPESTLPVVPDPASDRARAISPTVSRFLTTDVTDPSFESAATSALVAELLDFATTCHLDYATDLVAEIVSASPPSVEEAITGPYSSQWQAAMDAEMASWKSIGTYVDEVPPPRSNIVDGMWIFRRDHELHSLDISTAFLQVSLHAEIWLPRTPGFIGSFPTGTQWSLQRLVYALRQAPREWHDTLRTTLAALGFAPSTADPSLFLRTDTSLLPLYVLMYVDDLLFATADTEALTLVLHRFGFQFSSPLPTPLSTGHSLPAPPLDEFVEPSGPYPELVGCLIYLMTCTRPNLAYPLSLLARYVAPGRHRKVHWDAAKRVLRYLCSTLGMRLVLGGQGLVVLTGHADASWADDSATQRSSSCEAEIYAGAMAAQELRWLTYLLTYLGEQPRSPLVLYVDNKAMISLGQEHRVEHRTKYIALRYFLARELQKRGQLRLAYMATRANTADVFTKALLPGDHQRFSTVLGLLLQLCHSPPTSPEPPHHFTLPPTAAGAAVRERRQVGAGGATSPSHPPLPSPPLPSPQLLHVQQREGGEKGGERGRGCAWGCRCACRGQQGALGAQDSRAHVACRAAGRAGRTGQQGSRAHGRAGLQGAQGSRTAGRAGRAGLQGTRGAQGSRATGRTGLQGSRAHRAAGMVDTLEARLEDARRRHEANEYGPNLQLAVIEAGIRSVWTGEHPGRLASPRQVNKEGDVDVRVNAGGDQVGSNAGGTSRQRGVIHADEVGSVQARGMRSLVVAGSSEGDVRGRRSSLSPMLATHMTAGGIAPSYGYFKFTPDRISVTPLLVGRPDIITWKEAIEPQLEMAGLIGFARGTVAMPEEHSPNLRA